MNNKVEILQTKFFPPNLQFDFIPRTTLFDALERNSQKSIILVSVSSGFGKSTLIADFLNKQNRDFAWLSLSEKENEIQEFIKYFTTVIQVKVEKFAATINQN